MRVEIRFETEYRYEETVGFSIHLYRLFPRAGREVVVRRAEFQTNAGAAISYRRDLFDNEIASCWYPEKAVVLEAKLFLELEITPRNPFGFLLAPSAVELPFHYSEEEKPVMAPYLAGEQGPELPFWPTPTQPRPTVEVLVELNEAIRQRLQYERRDEGVARSPEETVALGSGACRDFAVLMAATLRRLGVAARLASGYLVETGAAERRAEGALHAWVEAYLPGAGWIGLDPTNGVFCDHHHILAAVGLTPADITPTSGRYFHPHGVSSHMTSTLHVQEYLPTAAEPKHAAAVRTAAAEVEARFQRHQVRLTLGGEPTYVPVNPEGSEWHITALGPTKLRYGYALGEALTKAALPQALSIYSPGKHYPGETNPRWSINLVWRKDGEPLFKKPEAAGPATTAAVQTFQEALLTGLKIKGKWLRAMNRLEPKKTAWVLPLDHDGKHFVAEDWQTGARLDLINAEGPAGLRLPLGSLPPTVSRRALTLELYDGKLHVFLPPFLQGAWLKLLETIGQASRKAGIGGLDFSGYVPPDEAGTWSRLAITADPGVLEINLPPCYHWQEYATWLERLEAAATEAGLRSCKQLLPDEQMGTGGGNHLLFGGPTLEENPLFTHPRWLIGILRYWQRHPALAYLFTGQYVGSASQAPRPDESASALYDLEMAYQFLESLPEGDHRYLIGETLRHLHTDSTGNTHRSEISFDKFWNQAFDGGCRGLIEFRAVESLPKAEWMSAIALLWHSLAAMLLDQPQTEALIDHGEKLHDTYFLPSELWADLRLILRDLRKAGLELPESLYREIYEWRFPQMLAFRQGSAKLEVRKALEPWPLLCETPLEGGNTSRFVDTSIERLEVSGNGAFAKDFRVFAQGRELPLETVGGGAVRAGLRYRKSALYPSLHPGIRPHMPLVVTVTDRRGKALAQYEFTGATRRFAQRAEIVPLEKGPVCRKLKPDLLTCDLRIA